jgi:hypothetical protein
MEDGGPPARDAAHPTGTALTPLPGTQNRSEGGFLGAFYADFRCKRQVVDLRLPFLVIPHPESPKPTFHCGVY